MKRSLGIFLILASAHVYALDNHPIRYGMDSLLPVRHNYSQNEATLIVLQDAEMDFDKTRNSRRAFVDLLALLRSKRPAGDNKGNTSLFNDLAAFSARLKLYALAIKCYSKAVQYRRGIAPPAECPPDSAYYGYLAKNDTAAEIDVYTPQGTRSEPVKAGDLWRSFNDGKTALSFALIIHVKQPIPGKRKAFTHINNVGHMFITLIKYNNDNSFVSRSFGFYPLKGSIFSATPIHPSSRSVFKDDARHDWDELAGKPISPLTFQKIIDVLKSYDQRTYHLDRNNCTDFGLNVAAIGGIDIQDTRGNWPLGSGNNPGSAGQSLLEGKFTNSDSASHEPLFVSTNVPQLISKAR